MRNKRVVVTQYGGPEVITVTEKDMPTPKAGEVRVKVLAAGVGLPDILAREGVHAETPRVPYAPSAPSAARGFRRAACLQEPQSRRDCFPARLLGGKRILPRVQVLDWPSARRMWVHPVVRITAIQQCKLNVSSAQPYKQTKCLRRD